MSSTITNSSVLRVVDNNRTNTKLTNKSNIINGTTQLNNNNNSNNHYQTNLTTQTHGSLPELTNKRSTKDAGDQHTSLATIFDQFTHVIRINESGDDQNENQDSTTTSGKSTAVLLNLACDFTSSKNSKSNWEAILYMNNLYLQIPAGVLFETSKEAFVDLLQYAEEELKCQNVVICLDKNCVEKCK